MGGPSAIRAWFCPLRTVWTWPEHAPGRVRTLQRPDRSVPMSEVRGTDPRDLDEPGRGEARRPDQQAESHRLSTGDHRPYVVTPGRRRVEKRPGEPDGLIRYKGVPQ
jgi:hypothetical protein